MKGFKNVVREIRRTIIQVLIIPSLLDGVLVFLLFYLLLTLVNLPPLYSLIPALFYTAFIIGKEAGINTLKMVEKYYPNLHEKLRTAADYADVDDIMVDELHADVIKEVRNVATSSFVSGRRIMLKVFCCIVLSFTILSITHFEISAADYRYKLQDAVNSFASDILQRDNPNALRINQTALGSGVGLAFNKNIYGKKHLAQLGNEELEVELRPSTIEFKVGKVKEAERKRFEEVFPSDVFLTTSATYEETIPRDHQEIVKNYFRRISVT